MTDIEYLEDLAGLIEYLGYKVGLGRVCIYCNGRGRARFPDIRAVQNHMVCNMQHEVYGMCLSGKIYEWS